MRQLWAVLKKEFIQIRRDPRTLGIILFAPLVMLFLYGYAVNFDIKRVAVCVLDQDRSTASREFIAGFSHSDYLRVSGFTANPDKLVAMLDSGKAKAILWLPEDFGAKLAEGRTANLFWGLDGSDANTATIVEGYFHSYLRSYSSRIMLRRLGQGGNGAAAFAIKPRVWYNPELKSVNFIIPGLIAVLLMMMIALLTAMSITGEKERNTFEQLAASPLRSWQLIVGKIIPYALVSFIGATLIISAGVFWFGVPLRGSPPLLFGFILLYLVAVLGIGLFFSTVAKTQQQAMFMVMAATVIPAILLSGFVFPIECMPRALRLLTNLVPAKFFLIALRGIFLKGVGLSVLWPEAVKLFLFVIILSLLVAVRFKKRLD